MSKTWKWILGIVLVLVLVGAMFIIGYTWQTHTAINWNMPFHRDWNSPMQREWNQRIPDGRNHPMMYDRGFVPFGGFFLLGGLVKLALFFGLLYGAYWLGRRNARITMDPAPAAPVDAPAAPEADPIPRKRTKKAE